MSRWSRRGLPDRKVFGDFLDHCEAMFDSEWGGFGGAPKFPRPVVVRTLMQLSERFGRDSDEGGLAWEMSVRTLRAMAAGGMHDHLGGGFHRYSVDRYWHVPHYEKMLYDQAQLAMAYLDAWQISGDATFRQVTEGIFRYLLETTARFRRSVPCRRRCRQPALAGRAAPARGRLLDVGGCGDLRVARHRAMPRSLRRRSA